MGEAHERRQVSFAGHRSQVIVLPIQKISQTLVRAKFLGLRLAFTSVWDTFCIGKTMTCELQRKPPHEHIQGIVMFLTVGIHSNDNGIKYCRKKGPARKTFS